MKELFEAFQNYFRIVIADTPALREQVHRLRYEVFCKEFHFEREEDCPGGLEQDEYDQRSIHCLIIHKASNMPAGCVRLVKTAENNPAALLPFEKYCGDSLYQGDLHPSRLPREHLSEISRLTVASTFRRRPGEIQSPLGNLAELKFDEVEYRLFPLISFVIFMVILSLSMSTKIQGWFAMMEPWLGNHLQKVGFSFQQAGEPTKYHGTRVAFYYTVERALQDTARVPMLRDIFSLIGPIIKAEAIRANLDWQEVA